MNPEIKKFWAHADLVQINPGRDDDLPEGWDVRSELRDIVAGRQVTEIGCGYGRLCTSFTPQQYVGYDVNASALDEARRRYPDYQFRLLSDENGYEIADIALLYAVCLHVHDDDISAFVATLCSKARGVLLCEIMGREWRREGMPPVFHREAQEYIGMFTRRGLSLDDIRVAPYRRYPGSEITFLVFEAGAAS